MDRHEAQCRQISELIRRVQEQPRQEEQDGGLCVWHYLHHSSHGRTKAERVSDDSITVTLPDLDGAPRTYTVPVDVRDKRVLVVVDGDLVWGGLPKSATVAQTAKLAKWRVETVYMRKPRLFEERPQYTLDDDEVWRPAYAVLELHRHFFLLAKSRSVVRRYRDSLSPQYLFIDVDRGQVLWRTTTY